MECFVISDTIRLDGSSEASIDTRTFAKSKSVLLKQMRNAYASFQIVLEDLECKTEQIRFRFTEHKPGSGIEFTVFYEWFHSYHGKLIPDLLVPMDTLPDGFPLLEQTNAYYKSRRKIFWVDCFLPKFITPGSYDGVIQVLLENNLLAELPYQITPCSPVLCDEALLHADFNNYADTISRNTLSLFENRDRYLDGSYLREELKYYKLAHEHRAFFHYLPYTHSGFNYLTFAPALEGEGKDIRVSDWSKYDEHFGPYFDGSAFAGTKRGPIPIPFSYLPFCLDWPSSYEKWGSEGYRIENRRILLDFMRHFEEKGWTHTVHELFLNHKKRYRFYPYDGDELRHSHDEVVAYEQKNIFHDLLNLTRTSFVLRTDSSWSFGKHWDTEMSDIFGFWAVGCGLVEFYPECFEAMRRKGNVLFEYTGVQEMGEPLTKLFTFPVRCLMNGASGVLYWNTTGVGDDFLNCPVSGGSEVLFYPSEPLNTNCGPYPSLRLKYHRNAMQTLDLMKMEEGTPLYSSLKDLVNEVYKTEDSQWTSPLPDSMKAAPHELTNAIIGSAPRNDPGRLAPIDAPALLREKVLTLLEHGQNPG